MDGREVAADKVHLTRLRAMHIAAAEQKQPVSTTDPGPAQAAGVELEAREGIPMARGGLNKRRPTSKTLATSLVVNRPQTGDAPLLQEANVQPGTSRGACPPLRVNKDGAVRSRRRSNRNNRASPAMLVKLNRCLIAEQKAVIIDAGFGGLLLLNCTKMPHKLGRWLAKCYDPIRSEIVISGRGSIPLNEDTVLKNMGLPCDGSAVKFKTDQGATNFIMEEYKLGPAPRIKALCDAIKAMNGAADDKFLRAWLIVVISSFLCPTTCLNVSPRCYKDLMNLKEVPLKNWCRFVVDQLKFALTSKKISFCACIYHLMVLYLDSLEVDVPVKKCAIRVEAWTDKLIARVIKKDLKEDGSYGKLRLKDGVGAILKDRLFGGLSVAQIFVSSRVPPGYHPEKKLELANMLNDMCSDYAREMEKMIEEFVKRDDNEAGTSTVPDTRKRRLITEKVLEESTDSDAEDDDEEENDDVGSGEESDDTEGDGVEDDSSIEVFIERDDTEEVLEESTDDEYEEKNNDAGSSGQVVVDCNGQAAVGIDDNQQVSHDVACTRDQCEDNNVKGGDFDIAGAINADNKEGNTVGNVNIIHDSETMVGGGVEADETGKPEEVVASCSDASIESDESATMSEWLEPPDEGSSKKDRQSSPQSRVAGLTEEEKGAYLDFVRMETYTVLPVPEINAVNNVRTNRILHQICRTRKVENESMTSFPPLCPRGLMSKIVKEITGVETKMDNPQLAKRKGLEAPSAVRTKRVAHRSRSEGNAHVAP